MTSKSDEATQQKHPEAVRLLLVDATMNGSPLQDELTKLFQVETTSIAGLDGTVVHTARPHGVLFDFDFPEKDGLDVIRDLKNKLPGLPVVMATLQHSESLAVWALRARLWDYYVKPLILEEIEHLLLEMQSLRQVQNGSSRERMVVEKWPRTPVETRFLPPTSSSHLEIATNYVKKHLAERISGSEIAGLTEMSSRHFRRVFYKHYGTTFQAYITQERMEEAARLLENPDIPVADVANSVGYRDTSYFSRMFRKHHGSCPTAFREQRQSL
ncbi:MAG: response regulator transcription factor [Pseudomonadales bacterium]